MDTDIFRSIQEYKEKIGQNAKNIIVNGLNLKKGSGGNYHCTFHSGEDKKPSMGWDEDHLIFKCFTCGKTIDIYGYYKDYENKQHNEIIGGSMEIKKSIANTIPPKDIVKEIPNKNYTDTFNKLYNRQTAQDKDYFIKRGLSVEIIDKYKLCVGDMKQLNEKYFDRRALIPISKKGQIVFYNARSLELEPKIKYLKGDGAATFFNIDYLETALEDEIIIVCEGEFDSLSLETIGIKSIALGGVGNFDNFIKVNTRKDIIFLTAFDNDETGNKETFKNIFPKIQIPYHDINEWLMRDKSDFKASIISQIQTIRDEQKTIQDKLISDYKATSAQGHLENFYNGINESVNTPATPTNFKELDNILDGGLYEGLYIIGAISSLGKTSWLLQICDQIAQQGKDVLYFSLEMSRSELMAKSISRLTFINAKNKTDAKTARGITAGKRWTSYSDTEHALIGDSMDKYYRYSEHLYLNEGLGTIGVKEIGEAVEKHIKLTGNKPIVVIDYLQILAPYDIRTSDKQNTDKAVFELKRISRDYKTPVIAISSLNRASYNSEINMAAFKESGAVEYSSDVLIGLQFQNQSETSFDVDQEKAKERREIEAKILKNRNGATGGTVTYNYYSLFNYFEETGLKTKKVNTKR